jgi:prepilin-type N-terminal cleavage/methylation domain-containing protein
VRHGGFTLIELLVAVTLLVMLLWGTSHIFDITVRAMNEATGVNEMTADSPAFYDALRKDIRGLETNGYLLMGQRSVTGYASHRMAELGRSTTFRCDWMEFLTNTENASTLDMNVVGQWGRVFWGHGGRTDTTSTSGVTFSQFATDWVLMRHQVLILGLDPPQIVDMNSGWPGVLSGIESTQTYPCDNNPTGNNGWSYGHDYQNDLLNLYKRIPTWFGRFGYSEPTYYHAFFARSLGTSTGAKLSRSHVLPHCGTFQIQYALAGDLRAGSGGTINWRDSSPAAGGRTVFQVGDAWPVLLKVTTQVFDPKDRLEKGRTFTAIVPVAR